MMLGRGGFSFIRALWVAGLCVISCGGLMEKGDGVSGQDGASTDPGQGGATATLWGDTPADAIPEPEALCSEPRGVTLRPCSEAEFRALLVGRWWQCAGTSRLPSAPDAVGVEFTDGWEWHVLSKSANGSIVRTAGANGTWELIDTSDFNGPCVYQLDIAREAGVIPSMMEFSDRPRGLLLNAGGDGGAPSYVAIP